MSTLQSQRSRGFNVIELILVIVLLVVVVSLFWIQRRDIRTSVRDSTRKTAINMIHHNLEEVYYAANKAYPEKITAAALASVDPAQLKDPGGVVIGDPKSDYRYESRECAAGKCKGYTLRANLEQEVDFVKESSN